jgi:DNA polymerase-3 subunit delta'
MPIDETFEMIKHALDSGRLAHGYLITGPVRGAAMDLALRVLQLLFCQSENKPCLSCERCRRVADRTECDIHWIFPELKSRVISVEQMRDKLIAEISKTSFSGGWKAGVLVGADRMNDASANAFLKTLEEPPDRTLFFLLSDAPQQLLPTIVSRCQRIDLRDESTLAAPLKERVLEALAGPLCDGPMENLALSSTLFAILDEIKEEAERLVKEEKFDDAQEYDEKVFSARVSARYREMRGDLFAVIMHWFRDLLAVKCGVDASILHFPAYEELYCERAKKLTLAQALYNLDAVDELSRKIEMNVPEETLLAYAIDRINHGT